MQNTTTTTTHTTTSALQTAFARELAMHGIVRVEFGTASAYWGHADVTTLEEARAAARQFFADAEKRRYCDSQGWHYPETVGIRVYPTSFEATNTTAPDWGIAYCQGECLGWVGYRGELEGDVDGYLEGHYDSQAQAYAAMNAALEMV